MNSSSSDRALGALALENTQTVLAWARGMLSRRKTLGYFVLSPVAAQQGQEDDTHLPIGGDCCKHSRRVWCPGHIAHG